MNTRSGIAATAAVVVGVGAAVAGAVGPSAAAGSHERVTVVEHAVTDKVIDNGKKGDSRGDLLAFHNPVYDARDKHRVGHDLGYCVRTKPGVAWECTWTLVLKRGTIVVQGPFRDVGDSVLAITGGTGDFKAAGGKMRLHALNAAGSKYRFVYHVTS